MAKIALATAGALLLMTTAQADTPIFTDPTVSFHWRTLMTNAVPLRWTWPSAAQSAVLTVSSSDGETRTVFARPTESCIWQVPTAKTAAGRETVFDLTLVFHAASDGSGEPLSGETLEARNLGRVGGVNGSPCTLRSGSAWHRVEFKRPVLPILADATLLTVEGTNVVFSTAPSWCGIGPLRGGTTHVVLTADETYSADLAYRRGLCVFVK